MTPSVLSENVASQTRRSPAPTRRCASRSVSTTLTAWPGNTARRTFADRDAEATPIAPSARSTLRQNHQRIVDAFFWHKFDSCTLPDLCRWAIGEHTGVRGGMQLQQRLPHRAGDFFIIGRIVAKMQKNAEMREGSREGLE